MMTVLLTFGLLILIMYIVKVFVLTSKQDKCFRRIWAMNMAEFNAEKDETYEQLFSVYDLDFSHPRLETKKLDTLMKDALEFDLKKNQYSNGIYIAPIVQNEIKYRMESTGKLPQFKIWAKTLKSKGAFLTEQIGV